jgi:hypothetical protein
MTENRENKEWVEKWKRRIHWKKTVRKKECRRKRKRRRNEMVKNEKRRYEI